MGTQEIIEIATFGLSLASIAYAIGKQSQRLDVLERDLNAVGGKMDDFLHEFDKRLERQANFLTRIDQKMLYLEERLFGEDTAARLRETK